MRPVVANWSSLDIERFDMPATTSPEALDGAVGGASSEAADEAEATDGGPAFDLFLF